MPWEALPSVKLEVPTRRGVFIDIDIQGSVSVGGDVISANWDGARPPDLSSAADTTATAGFAFDSSAGAIQAQTIYAEGGEIGNLDIVSNLTLATGGVIRTAASGQRVEVTEANFDNVGLYTGDNAETGEGQVRSIALGTDTTTRQLAVDILAPRQDSDSVGTFITVRSQSEDDSSLPPQIILGYNGGSTQTPEFKLIDDMLLLVADGAVTAPSIGFNTDVNTGIYSVTGGYMGFATNGVIAFQLGRTGGGQNEHYFHGMASGTQNTLTLNTSSSLITYISSSRTIKKNITDLDEVGLTDLLRPSQFKMRADKTNDDPNRWRLGLIAEDTVDADPRFGIDGSTSNYDDRAVLAAVIRDLQDARRRITELENRKDK